MNILLIFMSFDKCLVMIDLTSLLRSKYDIVINEERVILISISIYHISHKSLSRFKRGSYISSRPFLRCNHMTKIKKKIKKIPRKVMEK